MAKIELFSCLSVWNLDVLRFPILHSSAWRVFLNRQFNGFENPYFITNRYWDWAFQWLLRFACVVSLEKLLYRQREAFSPHWRGWSVYRQSVESFPCIGRDDPNPHKAFFKETDFSSHWRGLTGFTLFFFMLSDQQKKGVIASHPLCMVKRLILVNPLQTV